MIFTSIYIFIIYGIWAGEEWVFGEGLRRMEGVNENKEGELFSSNSPFNYGHIVS